METLLDNGELHASNDQTTHDAYSRFLQFLRENFEEFRRLSELRQQGWRNSKGDLFFQKQRHNADNAGKKMARIFYQMMKEIAQEMHQSTGALAIESNSEDDQAILDLCMAPGGFLDIALALNPEANALGFSLPAADGGHRALIRNVTNLTKRYVDITMLAEDIGIVDITPERPEAINLLPQEIGSGRLFDLVICDGQVLRTYVPADHQAKRQARRLTVSQLIIGLSHVKVGGTMVVLLHKIEARTTISLLQTFDKFSSIQVFKPAKHHGKRSSFYMIASNIESRHPDALAAVMHWQRQWKIATFGTDEEYEEELLMPIFASDESLENFKPKLVTLGRKIWQTQAEALERAPFMRENSPRSRIVTG